MAEYKNEVIFCIVNEGFSEVVMDAARKAGAKGGTVMRGRGTANPEAEKLFGLSVSPQKEVVMMVVESAVRNAVLHALYISSGLDTPGQGIAFSLPVDGTAGLNYTQTESEKSETAG